ncbi:putative late blight resistance protein-like protein R1B-12 [Forsythia ovata]|uniref:Late blight resistance protein-like protein R1B-12 n=1 Tax=Forsythia ovata TaxID=205694 RepID=A0ABD1VME3_9LAMI
MVDEMIVGFQDEIIQIASQLVEGPDNLQIISIVGMAGIGKTTIAKKLYNDSKVRSHFDKLSWCVGCLIYKRRKLLIDILSSVSNLKRDKILGMEDEELAECLYKILKGTRYLVVMDNIWDRRKLEDLKRYFPDDGTGSRILITSRYQEVEWHGSKENIVKLHPLSVDECWDLLEQKVFKKERCPPELKDIGERISLGCMGLPLFVDVISGHHRRLRIQHLEPVHPDYLQVFPIFQSLKKLRFLDLFEDSHYWYSMRIDPLFNLRYLAIPWLPSSIGRLLNLESLHVERGDNIPPFLLMMPKLRHLLIRCAVRFHENCDSAQINNLETLSFVHIFYSKDEEMLRCSPNLRRLKCQISKPCTDLSFLTQLQSLKLCYLGGSKVIRFPMNIKKLTLTMDSPWEIMSLIGTLPNLEILKLESVSFEGENWITKENEFQKLKFLKLDSLQLVQWNASRDHFPRLERLVLRYCYNLEKIPSELGYITTLRMIEAHYCGINVRNSAMQIEEEQLKNRNEELKVIIFGKSGKQNVNLC